MTEMAMVRKRLQSGYVDDINEARKELVKRFGVKDATSIDLHVSQAVMLATPGRNLVESNELYARLLHALISSAATEDEKWERIRKRFISLSGGNR